MRLYISPHLRVWSKTETPKINPAQNISGHTRVWGALIIKNNPAMEETFYEKQKKIHAEVVEEKNKLKGYEHRAHIEETAKYIKEQFASSELDPDCFTVVKKDGITYADFVFALNHLGFKSHFIEERPGLWRVHKAIEGAPLRREGGRRKW